MAKKTELNGFGVKVTHNDGVSGYLTGDAGEVLTFTKEADAGKFLKALKKTDHYSWNVKSVDIVNLGEEDGS